MKKYLCGFFFFFGTFWTEIFSQTTNQGKGITFFILKLVICTVDVLCIHVHVFCENTEIRNHHCLWGDRPMYMASVGKPCLQIYIHINLYKIICLYLLKLS